MTASIIILPVARRAPRGAPCPRCAGLRFVPFGRMNEAQQRWAPAKAILPCPDCSALTQVVPLNPESA